MFSASIKDEEIEFADNYDNPEFKNQQLDKKLKLSQNMKDSECVSPLQPRYLTRSNSAKRSNSELVKQESLDSLGSFKKPSVKDATKHKPAEPEQRKTMDISDEEKSDEASKVKESDKSDSPSEGPKKKRKKRRDVIFKTILRECRRYYQIQLSDLTGFISSKKARNDDYMYKCMDKFTKQFLKMNGSFDENFYLA